MLLSKEKKYNPRAHNESFISTQSWWLFTLSSFRRLKCWFEELGTRRNTKYKFEFKYLKEWFQ